MKPCFFPAALDHPETTSSGQAGGRGRARTASCRRHFSDTAPPRASFLNGFSGPNRLDYLAGAGRSQRRCRLLYRPAHSPPAPSASDTSKGQVPRTSCRATLGCSSRPWRSAPFLRADRSPELPDVPRFPACVCWVVPFRRPPRLSPGLLPPGIALCGYFSASPPATSKGDLAKTLSAARAVACLQCAGLARW